MHFVGIIDEFFLGHFGGDVERLKLFDERFFVLQKTVKRKPFSEGKFVFLFDLFGFSIGDDLRFVIVLEEVFKFLLVENDDVAVDDSDLIIVRHFEGNFGREWLKSLPIEFPR